MDKSNALESYRRDGFLLLRGAIPHEAIDALLGRYLEVVRSVTGRSFADPFGADLVAFYNEHPDLESQVYVAIRSTPWLEEFSRHPALLASVGTLLGDRFGLFAKIPFRIDMPLWTKELAYWHQDHFYVRGNTEVITAWAPMQDTRWDRGCLMVMPRSHAEGVIPHDLPVGKKNVPSNIFDREVRFVEMMKGDLLLFSALLMHSSGLNISDSIRYSIQARFTPLGLPVDAGMGAVLNVSARGEL